MQLHALFIDLHTLLLIIALHFIHALLVRYLPQVCTLQQELVTGCDAAGVKVNNKEVEKSMRKFMQDDALT